MRVYWSSGSAKCQNIVMTPFRPLPRPPSRTLHPFPMWRLLRKTQLYWLWKYWVGSAVGLGVKAEGLLSAVCTFVGARSTCCQSVSLDYVNWGEQQRAAENASLWLARSHRRGSRGGALKNGPPPPPTHTQSWRRLRMIIFSRFFFLLLFSALYYFFSLRCEAFRSLYLRKATAVYTLLSITHSLCVYQIFTPFKFVLWVELTL